MTSKIQECERCKTQGQVCWSLELKSEQKETKLMLCNTCLSAARIVWQKFMQAGKSSTELPELTDDSIMDFGKYQGKKLKNIPASYFLWLGDQDWINNKPRLARYINRNRAGLEEEISEQEDKR